MNLQLNGAGSARVNLVGLVAESSHPLPVGVKLADKCISYL